MTAARRSRRPAGSFGPIQLARRLGWWEFQVWRGVRLGLVPEPDLGGRWSAGLVEQFEPQAAAIRDEVGSLPDMGVYRAAKVLGDRFGCEVPVDAVVELSRRGQLPEAGIYKDALLYDGRAVEGFTDRDRLDEAIGAGRCVTADEAAQHLRIRRTDFDHLVRAGLLVPARWVRSSWQRRRSAPLVALYRVADLDALSADPRINWSAVRATPRGRVSLLATLLTATNDGDQEVEA